MRDLQANPTFSVIARIPGKTDVHAAMKPMKLRYFTVLRPTDDKDRRPETFGQSCASPKYRSSVELPRSCGAFNRLSTAAAWCFTFISALLAGPAIAATSGDGAALVAALEGWRVVRSVPHGLGNVELVVIDKRHERDRAAYQKAVNSICEAKVDYCKVLFWTDERMVPTAMPLSDREARALRADWVFVRRTGLRQLRLACDIEPDKSKCFSP